MTPGGIITSNYLAMCEVASSEQIRSVRCKACKGLGAGTEDPWKVKQWIEQLDELERRPKLDTDERRKLEKLRDKIANERQCKRCGGTGYRERSASREAADRVWNTVRCGKCQGSGEIVNEDAEDECPRCGGDGCVVPQTVRSTGSSKKGRLPTGATSFTDGAEAAWMPPEPAEDERVTEYSETEAVLLAVEAISPDAMEAVRLYNGPDGDKWAAHSWGRTFALWPLTSGGKGIAQLYLRRGELKGAGHLVLPADRIVAEREAESRTTAPDMLRRTLISRADREARLLESRMLRAIADAEGSVG
jgi:hypothetical protein